MNLRTILRRIIQRSGYHLAQYPFHTTEYLRHTSRRLEHLASLAIPVRGKTVLEVGAGAGDFTHYFLDRGCQVTVTDARESNLQYLIKRYPSANVHWLDLENPVDLPGSPFQVVHCYGVLYHLEMPENALTYLASACSEMLFLETKVTRSVSEKVIVQEDKRISSLSVSGKGSRLSRERIFEILVQRFKFAYIPKTQPNHPEFSTEWLNPGKSASDERAIFIGSNQLIDNENLVNHLIGKQLKQP